MLMGVSIGPRLSDFRGSDHREEATIDAEGCEWQGQTRREMVGGSAGSRHSGIIVTEPPRRTCTRERHDSDSLHYKSEMEIRHGSAAPFQL